MTERERLIELLKKGNAEYSERSLAEIHKLLYEKHRYNSATDKVGNLWDELADYLLANGVIVPPCKVGGKVYKPLITDDTHEPAIWDITITQITIDIGQLLNESYAIGKICEGDSSISFDFDDIGKTIFLTNEEAEKALAERSRG